MNYFENCKTVEEVKATYKQLAKKFHPDVYGEKGNDILKEIHNQLEKALKNVDKKYFEDVNIVDTDEVRAKKEELLKEALSYVFPEGALFALYWMNGLKPKAHINPLTNHRFTGWNVWTLEIEMLQKGFKSCNWSTFPQIKADDNSVLKGEKGTQITLAIVYDKKDKDGNKTDDKGIYYKAYTVFNKEQTAKGKENDTKTAEIQEVKQIGTKAQKEKSTKTKNINTKLIEQWEQQNLFKIA